MTEQPTPNDSWDEILGLKPSVLRGIYAFGFDKPSPIQSRSIPPMIKLHEGDNGTFYRKDIIAQAQSGSGKTGAFTIASLCIVNPELRRTQVLIIAPTHELALQNYTVLESIATHAKISYQLTIGGTPVSKNKEDIEKNVPQIIVGTAGRIHDLIRRKIIDTSFIKLIVLDEADEMLSPGFKDAMYEMFQCMNSNIQIALFSATLPPEVITLAESFMSNPVKILVKNDQLTLEGITQWLVQVTNDQQKFGTIRDIFKYATPSQTIIYCNSTRRVDDLHSALLDENFPVKKIHGKMDEDERRKINDEFKRGETRVIVTSDLYARGMDVQQVNVVINFDFPKDKSTYIHRGGRSGRFGRKGWCINFVTRYDIKNKEEFETYYNTQIDEMPNDWYSKIQM
jgi:translation initiation factor 4A